MNGSVPVGQSARTLSLLVLVQIRIKRSSAGIVSTGFVAQFDWISEWFEIEKAWWRWMYRVGKANRRVRQQAATEHTGRGVCCFGLWCVLHFVWLFSLPNPDISHRHPWHQLALEHFEIDLSSFRSRFGLKTIVLWGEDAHYLDNIKSTLRSNHLLRCHQVHTNH